MGSQALPPVTVGELVTRWQFAPFVTVFAVVAAGLYLWGALRVRRRHPARPWPLRRTALFLAGLVVVVIATESGIGSYDEGLFLGHLSAVRGRPLRRRDRGHAPDQLHEPGAGQ